MLWMLIMQSSLDVRKTKEMSQINYTQDENKNMLQ